MVGAKFYPRTLPLLGLLTVTLGFLAGSFWVWHHGVQVGEALGLPALGRALGIAASVALGVEVIAALIFGLPLLQRYIRRRPSLELREDCLALTLGLGKVHELPWGDIAGVRATKLAGRLGLGWVTVSLRTGQDSLGKDFSVPHLFLDGDVHEVAAVIEPLVASRGMTSRSRARERRRPRRR